jgi:glycine/D-amino acid oxidase-like deaminating enzyme
MRVGRSYKQHPVSGTWDVIVIGSGVGGLTTAGLLARHAGNHGVATIPAAIGRSSASHSGGADRQGLAQG